MRILLALLLLLPALAMAQIPEDFDSLGGNEALLERAQALNPEQDISIVQSRIVNRRWRPEFGLEGATTTGGDAYLNTRDLGFVTQLHMSPRWSVGVKYSHSFNTFNAEADNLIHQTKPLVPDVDYPIQSALVLLNWYPIYGKISLHDLGVSQFDVYLQGGYGMLDLKSGRTRTHTLGGGLGFWMSRHVTLRLELRHQFYQAQRYTGIADMNMGMASLGIGYLL